MSFFQNTNPKKTAGYNAWKLKPQKHINPCKLSLTRDKMGCWKFGTFRGVLGKAALVLQVKVLLWKVKPAPPHRGGANLERFCRHW